MDPRRGQVSASAMQQIALCPGSHALGKSTGLPSEGNTYAMAGTKIAAYLEAVRCKRRSTPELTPGELEIALKCQRNLELIKDELRVHGADWLMDDKETVWLAEMRLWGMTTMTNQRFSGRFDLAAVNATRELALIVDDKSGWGEYEPAETNLQLRTLAVLAFKELGVKQVYVALNQPAKGRPSIACYDIHALIAACGEIESYVESANTPNADRRPSRLGCRYCSAKSKCMEATQVLINVSTGVLPADWPGVLEQCEIAQLVIDDLRAKAKAVLQSNPKAIPGWELAPGAVRTTIKDPHAAYQAVEDIIDLHTFMGCCSTKIGDLTTAFAEKAGIKNKKTARTNLETRLAGNLEHNQNAPSLKKVGDSKAE